MSKVRSGPVYVERDGEVISLVFEGEARVVTGAGVEGQVREWVGRPDVYVINGDGVRFVRHKGSDEPAAAALAVGVVAFIVLWCAERLLRR